MTRAIRDGASSTCDAASSARADPLPFRAGGADALRLGLAAFFAADALETEALEAGDLRALPLPRWLISNLPFNGRRRLRRATLPMIKT